MFRLLLIIINAYNRNTHYLSEYIRPITLEAAESIIDGWILTLDNSDYKHPIISAIVLTGQ